ncbi:MATE family efflux transporter [Ruminococcus sp. FC2018]|uniref:MATE family efflux transporter n=1 Tax=Ruminococcus sp. FC2018 TaxID=1410617 RepID=UPI0004905047|nr:MATE family efflux transporter [Ruminococcus sp. FC2018]
MIKRIFRQMLLTQILSSMTVMLCMLIDSIMIGRFLGVESMTAYGLATPVLLVFAAIGSMLSAGVQVMSGKTMGSGDKKGTDACFTISVILVAAVSVVGLIAVLGFTDPICQLLGAAKNGTDSEVYRLTKDYLKGFIIGAPAFLSAQVMVPYMQISGSRIRLVVAVAAMTVGDIIFDALNVFVFKQGTFGMGLASSLSYYIAFVIGVAYFFKKSCIFRFRIKLVKARLCARLLKDGVPTLINQVSLVLLTFVLNRLLLSIEGEIAVAAYSVITTAGNICYAFSSGIASVALMLSSIFYSDEDTTSLHTLVKIMIRYAVMICAVVTVISLVAATPMVTLFLTDKSAKGMAVVGFRLFVLSLVPCAINTSLKNYYQGIDKVHLTRTISVLQNFALPALSSYLLSLAFGINGVWLGFLSGETLTLLFIGIVVFIKKGKGVNVRNFALLPDDYGVKEEDCFEMSVRTSSEVVVASEKAFDFCREHGRSSKFCSMIALCIEEMANNIVEYGFDKQDTTHSIDIRVMLKPDESVIRIRDNCKNFDPVDYLELHKGDDKLAHIGIRMIMGMVKDANYVNSLGLNNLTLKI